MKKFVSLLLTALMLATMLCVFALPASAEAQTIPGTDITWELTENDTKLIIDGEGAMPNYDIDTYEDRPWHSAAETVTTVQVKPGITTLGDYAFYQFGKMTSVTIPDGVTSIGESAFNYCESLTSITIPLGVTNIGDSAFGSCTSLESVTIPSGVTSVGNSAFGNCSGLKSVMIPYGVTGISDGMFEDCTHLTIVTIPSSVTSIDNSAFDRCTSLTSITIPYGVKSIGNGAFQNCINLESISFPSSITRIGNGVFEHCSNLTSITVKAKTPPDWMDLTTLFNQNAKSILYIPDGMSNVYKPTVGAWLQVVLQKKAKEAYVVDDQPGKNGTIMLDKDCFPEETYTAPNQTVTVTVMPAGGYRLKADSLSVVAENGAAIALTQDETDPMKYTFTMPCSNVTVKAEFEEITDESEAGSTPEGSGEGSVLSDGNLWIIIAVAVLALAGVAALVIVKKKTKPAQE